MKILAVEDDPVAQLVLKSALISLGHEVVLADDGESAWELLSDTSLRLVVSDWRLPRLDGLRLCRRIREKREDYVSFILITQQSASNENLDEAFAAGVDDFLTKPVNVRDLKLCLHVAGRILDFTSEMRKLESFLPICSYCKKVRDDAEYWKGLETYFRERHGTKFSHGICPECYERHVVPEMKNMGVKDPPSAFTDPSED